MTLIETMLARRSRRRFEPRPVEREIIDSLLRATLSAPSSKNCRSTRLAVIEDPGILGKISLMRSSGSTFLKDAPLAIAVMADSTLTDLWAENCAISATYLQLAAESLGLGSCWVHVNGRLHNEHNPDEGTAREYLRTVLPVPAEYDILCIVAIGYPADSPKPRPEHDDQDKVMFL